MAIDTAQIGQIDPRSAKPTGVGDMARAPASLEDLNFDELSDGQLRELIHRAREHLSQRITARLDELRTLALEVGLSVNVSPTGEGGARRRGSKSAGQRHTAPDRRGK